MTTTLTSTTNKTEPQARTRASAEVFKGFAPPTSNTTYTPNQFFDVCLPYYSRGVVRLVAYMIRKTLGWCDAHGNPQEDQILVSYQDLVEHAGISRDMIRRAIDEAIEGRFITCVRKGCPSGRGSRAVSALYELCWDDSEHYIKDPKRFRGFYEGEGNRTDIPNQFFDYVIPNEPLSVVKVVGSVIRFSIGFQARRGRRRQQVALSYTQIQHYAHIKNRTTLSQAIQAALEHNYIVRIQEGIFTPMAPDQIATTYALKWLDLPFYLPTGQKNVPGPVRKTYQDRSEKRTRTGQKNVPENRSEKRTSIKIKQINNTIKQQQPAAADNHDMIKLLRSQGFSTRDAKQIAKTYPTDRIRNQINWLRRRTSTRNRLGMLRCAIEEDWPEPNGSGTECQSSDIARGMTFAAHFYAGLAGNEDRPTAEPSANDTELAARYVARLLEIWPAEELVADWGREFGALVAKKTAGDGRRIVSCVTALRSHSDEFYKTFQANRQRAIRKAVEQARQEHEREFRPQYVEYLRAENRRIREENPEAYRLFQEKRAEKRAEIEKNPFFIRREKLREQQLRHFDGRLLLDLKEFFDDVLGFWQWDKECNPEHFDESAVTV